MGASSLPMSANTGPTRSSARRQHTQTVQKWKEYSQHDLLRLVPIPTSPQRRIHRWSQSCVLFAAVGKKTIFFFNVVVGPPVQTALMSQGVY